MQGALPLSSLLQRQQFSTLPACRWDIAPAGSIYRCWLSVQFMASFKPYNSMAGRTLISMHCSCCYLTQDGPFCGHIRERSGLDSCSIFSVSFMEQDWRIFGASKGIVQGFFSRQSHSWHGVAFSLWGQYCRPMARVLLPPVICGTYPNFL